MNIPGQKVMCLPCLCPRKADENVAKQLCTDGQFIAVWNETGGRLQEIADRLGFSSIRAISNRRATIEKRRKIVLASASNNSTRNAAIRRKNNRRVELAVKDATFVVYSDAHIWPGPRTTAQRATIEIIRRLKPSHVIANGDVFDGAKISRFPASIWAMEARPNVRQELEACSAFQEDIRLACPEAYRLWLLGNHDMRLEARLASLVPEYEGVPGFALKDHFPEWTFAMALFVNDSLVIKHRIANGIHAVYNNAVKSGRSIVTGHLHSLKVTPWTDYNGTRYGVDTGTLADPEGPQFDYMEENPASWRSGFAVLTIKDGRLMQPELAQVWDEDHIEFRGELIRV